MRSQRVAITGLSTPLAQRLLERLLREESGVSILGLDVRRPMHRHPRLSFCDVDLTDPTVDARLADVLQRERIDTVVHLAFRRFPSRDVDFDHDLETVGSFSLLAACAAAKVRRIVVQSTTMAYGASGANPNFLSEDHPLHGHPDAHNVQNRVEVEAILADWAPRHPDVEVSVLRHCWVMGPSWFDRVVEFFERSRIPTVLGYDPLMQFVHERDLVDVFERAVLESHPGVFNVVGRGVAPLSTLLALAGKRNVAVPRPLLYRTAWLSSQGGSGDAPAAFFDYLRFLWVADGARAWREFGEPIYSTTEAWSAFVGSRRLRRLA